MKKRTWSWLVLGSVLLGTTSGGCQTQQIADQLTTFVQDFARQVLAAFLT